MNYQKYISAKRFHVSQGSLLRDRKKEFETVFSSPRHEIFWGLSVLNQIILTNDPIPIRNS